MTPAIATGTTYCTTLAPKVGLAAAPTADAVATLDTLEYPVHVALVPSPPSVDVVVAEPEVTLPAPDVAVAVVDNTVPVAVAVTDPTTVPDTLAIPPWRRRTAGVMHSQTVHPTAC